MTADVCGTGRRIGVGDGYPTVAGPFGISRRARNLSARSVIIWHLLDDPDAPYRDLGADHYARTVNTNTNKRNHIRQLEALGYRVTIEPAA